jgi:hypothetical protein
MKKTILKWKIDCIGKKICVNKRLYDIIFKILYKWYLGGNKYVRTFKMA